MSDFIIIDGDIVCFEPILGLATVVPLPGKIAAKGGASFIGKKVCVKGDEEKVEVKGCMYVTSVYSVPGVGTLKIDALVDNQVAQHTQSRGKKVLLKGGQFKAKFEVVTPAMQTPEKGGAPDPTTQYRNGKGIFITINTKWRGT